MALDDAVLFTEWAVGHAVDGRFEELYRTLCLVLLKEERQAA